MSGVPSVIMSSFSTRQETTFSLVRTLSSSLKRAFPSSRSTLVWPKPFRPPSISSFPSVERNVSPLLFSFPSSSAEFLRQSHRILAHIHSPRGEKNGVKRPSAQRPTHDTTWSVVVFLIACMEKDLPVPSIKNNHEMSTKEQKTVNMPFIASISFDTGRTLSSPPRPNSSARAVPRRIRPTCRIPFLKLWVFFHLFFQL